MRPSEAAMAATADEWQRQRDADAGRRLRRQAARDRVVDVAERISRYAPAKAHKHTHAALVSWRLIDELRTALEALAYDEAPE